MNVKIIKTEKDYQAAMSRLSDLMSRDPNPGSKDGDELELLALVVQDFERKTVPPVKVDPIESILFRMDQMGLTRKDLTKYIGSISKVSEVLSRKSPLSLPMIRRLHQGMDIPVNILIEDAEAHSLEVNAKTQTTANGHSLFAITSAPARWSARKAKSVNFLATRKEN